MRILAVAFILVGLINLYSPLIKWFIKIKNSSQGIKTNITKETISIRNGAGIILLLIGLITLFFS